MDEEFEDKSLKFGGNSVADIVRQMMKPQSVSKYPTQLSSALVTWSVTLYCVVALGLSLIISMMDAAEWYTIVLMVIFAAVLVGIILMISRQPRASKELAFTVPLVPWLPALSIMINIYLMTQLDVMTWVRFIVWIVVGLLIYFCYGVFNSTLRYKRVQDETKAISESSETVATTVGGGGGKSLTAPE